METSWRTKKARQNLPHPKLVHCHPLGARVREPWATEQPCSVQATNPSLQQPAFRPQHRHPMAIFALLAKIAPVKFKVNTPSLSLLPLQHNKLLFPCKFNEQCTSAGHIASSSAVAYLFPEHRHGHPGQTAPHQSRGSCRAGLIRDQARNL